MPAARRRPGAAVVGGGQPFLFKGHMRRTLGAALAAMMVAAPGASAGEVSGRLVFCTGSDICRYFSKPGSR